MRIFRSALILFCFVNFVRSEESDSEFELQGDSWSKRIRKINRKQQAIELASEDSAKQANRWEKKEETGDSAIRYRGLGQVSGSLESENRFESQREHLGDGNEAVEKVGNWENGEPSPILLPPYAVSSVDEPRTPFYESPWRNESSRVGKPSESSFALEPIRVYEITTLRPSSDASSRANYEGDSSKTSRRGDDHRWWDILRKASVNTTEMRSSLPPQAPIGQNSPRAFYINDQLSGLKGISNSKPAFTGRNNPIKNSRGNRKYQHDFQADRIFMRKNTIGQYDWQRRTSSLRSNHFKFNSDSKTGAVPGIPGRDYPVHQQHTHLNLRNVADRFPCPTTLTTHVYLADRASRCQIFYVCYGSKTGVPMVCPNGTLFSESLQVCDWWFNVSC